MWTSSEAHLWLNFAGGISESMKISYGWGTAVLLNLSHMYNSQSFTQFRHHHFRLANRKGWISFLAHRQPAPRLVISPLISPFVLIESLFCAARFDTQFASLLFFNLVEIYLCYSDLCFHFYFHHNSRSGEMKNRISFNDFFALSFLPPSSDIELVR